ncbi:Nn.00g026510.m01.CDS01 [Neocucurbitaria sp. VM-36]
MLLGKALSWVWNKLKVAFEDLINFLGFLFKWGDVRDAKDSIASLLDASLDWGVDQVEWTKDQADAFFKDLRSTPTNDPPAVADKPRDHSTKVDEAQSSVGFNWANYQFKHGGGSGVMISGLSGIDSSLLEDILPKISDAVQNATKDIDRIYTDVVAIFKKSDSNFSIAEVLETIAKDAAVLFIDIMKSIFDILMTVVKDLLKAFKSIGDHVIEIPVFSALYKMISGHDLTLFDALSLMAAIPATFMHKMIKQEALPKIDGVVDKNLIAAYAHGTASKSQESTINSISGYGFLGITLLSSLTGVLDWAFGDFESMSMMSQTATNRAESLDLKLVAPSSQHLMAKVAARESLAKVKLFSALNVGCAYLSLALSLPIGAADWKWGPWAIGAFRAIAQTILLWKSPSGTGARRAIAAVNIILGVVQYGFSVDSALKQKSSDQMYMKMISSTCGLIGTCAKVGAVEAGENEIGGICEIVYVGATFANVAFQGVYLIQCADQKISWDPMQPNP